MPFTYGSAEVFAGCALNELVKRLFFPEGKTAHQLIEVGHGVRGTEELLSKVEFFLFSQPHKAMGIALEQFDEYRLMELFVIAVLSYQGTVIVVDLKNAAQAAAQRQ